MPVDIFGHTYVGSSQRIVSGGVTLSQINNTFLRRDGANTAIGDINLESHKLINVKDPTSVHDAATKSYVDTEKVSKSGDNISGDIIILLNDDPLRTFGVSDINNGQSVSLLLGNADNQIRHNFGHPLKISASHGIKFTCPAGEILQMGTHFDGTVRFKKDIVMDNQFITGLRNPEGPQYATTKQYVDTKCVKNAVGYIPNIISNNLNKTGFIISSSSEFELNMACNVFSIIGEWLSAVNTDFWIQVRCPERVRIHKFAVKGTKTSTIRVWKLQATNDEITWDDIFDNEFDGNSAVIDEGHSFHESESLIQYQTYRIFVINAIGENPGLSYWQLYTVDALA